MNETDESLPKLDEIIQLISNEIWKRTYLSLIKKIQDCNLEVEITGAQSIDEFRKELKDFAKQHSLKYKEVQYPCYGIYITLEPSSITISIKGNNDKNYNIGDFCISAPPNCGRSFSYKNYKAGILWIKNYLEIYPKTTEEINSLHDKYYLCTKNAEIVNNSIMALCHSINLKNHWIFHISTDRILNKIVIEKSKTSCEVYEITIINKSFTDNSSILVNLLNDPREMKVQHVLNCVKIERFYYPKELSYFGIYLDYFDDNVFF